jgi:hypothetical protein
LFIASPDHPIVATLYYGKFSKPALLPKKNVFVAFFFGFELISLLIRSALTDKLQQHSAAFRFLVNNKES